MKYEFPKILPTSTFNYNQTSFKTFVIMEDINTGDEKFKFYSLIIINLIILCDLKFRLQLAT